MQPLCSLSVLWSWQPAQQGLWTWEFSLLWARGISSKLSDPVLGSTSCKANGDSSVPAVPIVLNRGWLRGWPAGSWSDLWWLCVCGIAQCPDLEHSSVSLQWLILIISVCKLHRWQSCPDITQFWVYFAITTLSYLNLYLELAELARSSTAFNGCFFTCLRHLLQLLWVWLFFLITESWIPVIPVTFRLHITLQHFDSVLLLPERSMVALLVLCVLPLKWQVQHPKFCYLASWNGKLWFVTSCEHLAALPPFTFLWIFNVLNT